MARIIPAASTKQKQTATLAVAVCFYLEPPKRVHCEGRIPAQISPKAVALAITRGTARIAATVGGLASARPIIGGVMLINLALVVAT